jgi:hypothetical protein
LLTRVAESTLLTTSRHALYTKWGGYHAAL